MNRIQCPCQVPINVWSICAECNESPPYLYVEHEDGTVSGCADGCPCDGTGFVDFNPEDSDGTSDDDDLLKEEPT